MIALKPYPAMKDSGVPWLGDVPEHWEAVSIARIGQLFKGSGGNKDDEVASGIPCVRYGDLYTRHEFFVRSTKACVSPERASSYTAIRHGDLLFAASGETIEDIGRSAVNLMHGEVCCGGDILLLRPDREVNAKFLGYAADAAPSRHQKASTGRGFTVVHIYASQIKRLILPLPPLPEQAAIVRFLDHADRRIRRYIRAKQKLIKLLEEQKQAIIHHAVTRGLDPNVRLKPSGVEWLEDLPAHWDLAELRRLVVKGRSITYGIVQPGPYETGGHPMIRAQDYSFGWASPEKVYRVSSNIEMPYCRARLSIGDIVYTIVGQGSVGNVAVVPPEFDGANITQTTARISIDPALANTRFIAAVLSSPVGERQLRRCVKGVGQPGINLAHLRLYKVPLPPLHEQDAIARELQSVGESIHALEVGAKRQIALVAEYRTRLIADVVTGKLDVREAAARLPAEIEEPEPLDDLVTEDNGDGVLAEDVDGLLEEAEA